MSFAAQYRPECDGRVNPLLGMPVWRGEGNFLELLKADADVKQYLTGADIEERFDLGYHTKHVDTIFARVFGKEAMAAAKEKAAE